MMMSTDLVGLENNETKLEVRIDRLGDLGPIYAPS